jgi:HD superfamily phosphohydrolase
MKNKLKKKQKLAHEDISVLYVHRVFSDLKKQNILENSDLYFLCVASLINAKLSWRDETKKLDEAIGHGLAEAGYYGGADFHRLMRPIISGPFDVDRMDYIQRDARNTGVHIGGIEWSRIVKKLVPCLANHKGNPGEPREVVLISKVKNQHVLDDFMFSLFQMYAQVYMHPKIVGLEESIREILEAKRPKHGDLIIDFNAHCSLSDEKFRILLDDVFGIKEVNALLNRRKGARFRVSSFPMQSGLNSPLKKEGFELLKTQARPMMKDSMGVFLYQAVGQNPAEFSSKGYFVQPWIGVSPIAAHFQGVKLNPEFWVRRGE